MPDANREARGLTVRVRPRARKSRVLRVREDGVVEIAVAAPPERGRANEALLRFLARVLGIPRTSLSLVPSTRTRPLKVVVLKGMSPVEAQEHLKRLESP